MILEKTIDLVKQICKYHKIMPPKVNRIVVGQKYSGVELLAFAFDPFLGLAQTLPNQITKTNNGKIEIPGQFTARKITELLEWSYKPPSIDKVIGIATLNAISQYILEIMNPYVDLKGNLVDLLKIDAKSVITCIGLNETLIQELKGKTEKIMIVADNISNPILFEKFKVVKEIRKLSNEFLNPDVLICTDSFLINDTAEEILSKFRRPSIKIIVMGPTASMIPDILFDYAVDVVAGIKILNSNATIKVVQEGGGTDLFKKYGVTYNLIKEESKILF